MQRRISLLYTALILAILLYVFHYSANFFYLYWSYWWFDVLMHFLGGVTGGFATLWVLFYSGHFFSDGSRGTVFTISSVLFCVMVAGVAWELFEYFYNITDSHEGYALDVINDLVLDASGAILVVLLGRRKK